MKRTVFTCDKCEAQFEQPAISFAVPNGVGPKLASLLQRPAAVALDFCGGCSVELARLIAEPHLTFLALEVERDDAKAAAQRCLARVRELEAQLAAVRPNNPPTEPPQGIPDPLLDAPATDVPPPSKLPSGFALPAYAFPFTTEPPAERPAEPPAASSPLSFAHSEGTP